MSPTPSVPTLGARSVRQVGRITRSADFVRILGTPIKARSLHFALHHVDGVPATPARAGGSSLSGDIPVKVEGDLSTGVALHSNRPVDDSGVPAVWLGSVVPKRHARRAVTRSMLKRQINVAMAAVSAAVPAGLWVVRLRAPFDRKQFVSATSDALVRVVRDELRTVFARVAGHGPDGAAR